MTEEKTYDVLWLVYLRAHWRRKTRLIHYLGISIIVVSIIATIVNDVWWIAAAGIVVGYLTAWMAHWTVQHNVPVMFEGPRSALWSLMSGLRMYVLGLSGQLGTELRRARISDDRPS